MIELIPYPDFEEVFTETNELGKYVFFPLVSIHFNEHEKFKNQSFHIVSLWDTGEYEANYFDKHRVDNYTIHFDLINNKLAFKDKLRFPYLKFLPKAYGIIADFFEKNKEEFFANDSYDESNINSELTKKGQALILERIPEFRKFEAGHYFDQISAILLAKYKLKTGIKVKPMRSDGTLYSTKKENENIDLNPIKNANLMSNILGKPYWLQGEENPLHSSFIGQVDEGSYLSGGAAFIYCYLNNESKQQTQVFQWG